MEKNNTHHHADSNSGFINGFLWGIVIGGCIVFLLGTKKGKKLLKLITEEGLDSLASIEEAVEEMSTNEPVEKPLHNQQDFQRNEQVNHADNGELKQETHTITHFPRRFFRGIPKRN